MGTASDTLQHTDIDCVDTILTSNQSIPNPSSSNPDHSLLDEIHVYPMPISSSLHSNHVEEEIDSSIPPLSSSSCIRPTHTTSISQQDSSGNAASHKRPLCIDLTLDSDDEDDIVVVHSTFHPPLSVSHDHDKRETDEVEL